MYELLGNANCKTNHLQNIGHIRPNKTLISSKPRNRSWKAREKMVRFESLNGPRGSVLIGLLARRCSLGVNLCGIAVYLRFS